MASLLELSEATALGLHAMVLLAQETDQASSDWLARTLDASKAHLSKVLKSLTRAGLLVSKRGPGGGYVLARPADTISLLAVYEALQGPVRTDGCLFDRPLCDGVHCLFGGLVQQVRAQVYRVLSETTVAQAAENTRRS